MQNIIAYCKKEIQIISAKVIGGRWVEMKALIGEDGDLAQQSQRRNKGLKGQVSV